MRKTYAYLICLILFISAFQLKAQNCWSPLGSGIGINPNSNGISNMITYNGNLIAAGDFDSISGIAANHIAAWNGSSWSALGTGLTYQFFVSALAVYNNELYVAGQFDSAGGIPVNNIAKWNGTSWSAVGSGIPGYNYNYRPYALAVYSNELYVGGRFDTAGGIPVNNIAKWNGAQWSPVDSGGLKGTYRSVGCMAAYNGILYVGGSFDSAGSVVANNIAAWNDTVWSPLNTGIGANSGVHDIAFYQGMLYADVRGSNDSIYVWNGSSWSSNTTFYTNFGEGVSLFTFNGNLLIGGGINSSIGGVVVNNLAQWNGSTWTAFGGGVTGYSLPSVDAFCTYNGNLYIGGYFAMAGSDSANSIAEYTCATDGIHEISADQVHVYPNPTTGMVNITIDNAGAGSSVQVYDLLGRKVFQSGISSGNTSINLSGHASGSYIYHISGASGESISAGTLIIE